MSDCVFCKIVAGEIPCAKLVETESVISFLDIGPVNPGHSLVVTRRHCESILQCTEEELEAAIVTVQRLAKAVLAATGAVGCNVLQNNHACAGQLVPHVHFHVIPRAPKDGFNFGWRSGRYEEGDMEAMRQKVLAGL